MHFGFIYSILLHIGIFLILMFGIDYSRNLKPQEDTILLEMIPISTITNVKTTVNDVKPLDKKKEVVTKDDAKQDSKTVLKDSEFDSQNVSQKIIEPKKKPEEAKPEKKAEEIKQPEPKKEDPKPEVKQDEKKKETSEENKEKIPTKDIKKEPEPKKVEKKPEKKPEPKKENKKTTEKDKKKPEAKKDKKDKKKDSSDDDLANSVLKSLQEGGKKSSKNKKKQQSLNDIMENAIKGDTTSEFDNESEMSLSEIDAIRSQISRAWRVTSFSGGKDNKNLKVTVKIQVEEDGEVKDVKVTNRSIPNGVDGQVYNAFVDSVIRAIRTASPLQNLPKEKHNTWNEMELVFDSSGMIY